MDKLDKVLEYVTRQEEKAYKKQDESFDAENMNAYGIYTALASAFQRVRILIEQLQEDNNV